MGHSTMVMATQTLDPKQMRAALRVLDTLDRWDDRVSDCYRAQRKHARSHYRAMISIVIPPAPEMANSDLKPSVHQVFARNLSQGGLSFIFHGKLFCNKIVIGLKSGDPTNWLHAEIVRSREVQDGFWEYGVAFRNRIDSAES